MVLGYFSVMLKAETIAASSLQLINKSLVCQYQVLKFWQTGNEEEKDRNSIVGLFESRRLKYGEKKISKEQLNIQG